MHYLSYNLFPSARPAFYYFDASFILLNAVKWSYLKVILKPHTVSLTRLLNDLCEYEIKVWYHNEFPDKLNAIIEEVQARKF